MKNKLTFLVASLFLSLGMFAQTPEKINYQAVARDATGNPLVGTSVTLQFDIIQSSAVVYSETQSLTTNQFGLFTAAIGAGTVVLGNFSTIAWGSNPTSLQVTVNGDVMPTTQLLSVPYALYSKESLNGPMGAQGPAGVGINWLGTMSTVPSTANLNDAYYNSTDGKSYIYDGITWQILAQDGNVNGDNWGTDIVNTSGGNILGDGTTSNPIIVIDNDSSKTNELQMLNFNTTDSNILEISNGNGVSLSSTIPTANQVLTWNGSQWIAQTPGSGADNWGSQAVVISGTNISGDGTSANPIVVIDNDTSATNEIELPATAVTNQVLTWNGSAWIAQTPGSGADNWGSQAVVISGTNISGDGTAGNPLIVIDNDTSATNEIQNLTTSGNNINISSGTGTTISATAPTTGDYLYWNGINWVAQTPAANTDNQNLINGGKSGNNQTVNIQNGTGTTFSVADADSSINNELITSFGINGTNLEIIEGGNSQTVPLTSIAPNDADWTQGAGTLYPTTLTDSVGIGTNTPNSKLHLAGNYSNSGTQGTFLDLQNTFGSNSSQAKVGIRFKTSNFPNGQHTKGGIIYSRTLSNARGDIHFLNNSNDDVTEIDYLTDTKMIIKNNGNVGIGISSPTAGLHLNNTLRLDNLSGTAPAVGSVLTSMDAQGNAEWQPLPTPAATLWTQGSGTLYPTTLTNKVGVGTNSPVGQLDVTTSTLERGLQVQNSFTSANNKYGIYANASGGGTGDNVGIWGESFGTSSGISYGVGGQALSSGPENRALYGSASGGTLNWAGYFASGDVYIQNNLGIGTTTPGAKLEVVGSTSVNATTDGFLSVGANTTSHLTMDGNEIQARSSTGTSTLYLNYWGSNVAMVSSASGANVGVGISSPTKKLHVVKAPTTTNDAAIYGSNTTASGSGFYGAMAYDAGTTNYGVFAHSDAIGNTSPLGVRRAADGALVDFWSGSSVEGQISVSGNTVTYGAFTGVHYAVSSDKNLERGMLVSLTNENDNFHGRESSEILYGITTSKEANDPKIMGAYLSIMNSTSEPTLDNPHQVMAVGNGDMWVVDQGKDIKTGDYLISSNVKGHAMLDDGTFDVAYIVARVSEPINWSEVTETIDGVKHKKITVFYESFIANHKAEKLEKELKQLQSDYKTVKADIESIKMTLNIDARLDE